MSTSEEKIEVVDAYPVWSWDCPNCGADNMLADGDFDFGSDQVQECNATCENCGRDYLVKHR
jgi:ribosomal protein S27AE